MFFKIKKNLFSITQDRFYTFMIFLIITCISFFRLFMLQHYNISLFVDEAQYWFWSKNPGWGYFSKPPLIAWSIAIVSKTLGDSPYLIRLPSLLYYITAILFSFILSKRIYGIKTATWTALTITSMPLAALCPFMTTDAPLFFFWSLSLLVFYALYQRQEQYFTRWIALGSIWGLGILAKYYFLLLPLSCFLFLCTTPQWKKKLIPFVIALFISGIFLFPNVLWNIENHFPTWQHIASDNLKVNNYIEWSFTRGALFVLGQFVLASPILGIVFLGLLFNRTILKKLLNNIANRYLFITFCLPLILVTAQASKVSANANWLGPAWISGLMLAIHLIVEKTKRKLQQTLLVGNFILNLLLILFLYNTQFIYHHFNLHTPDLFARIHGWDVLAQKSDAILRKYPNYSLIINDREIFSYFHYELRNSPMANTMEKAKAWSSSVIPHNHYELTRPFCPLVACLSLSNELYKTHYPYCTQLSKTQADHQYILLSTSEDINEFKLYFPNIKLLHRIEAHSLPNHTPVFNRELFLYDTQGFLCPIETHK